MRRFVLSTLGAAIGLVVLAIVQVAALRPIARAQAYSADTSTSPFVSLQPDALTRFWSQQALARGVTTDAQWNTAMGTLFSPANWPGVDATALAFLRTFFVQYVHVGVP